MDENRSSQQNQDYDPEKDGYNPDRIYDAPKGYRPKERQHGFYTAPLADDENTGKKTYYPGFIVSVIGVILAFVSMVLAVTALILTFFGIAGLLLNILSFITGIFALSMGIVGGKMNLSRGYPWGKVCIAALILSAAAILSSGALLMFTSCSALLHCTAFVLY